MLIGTLCCTAQNKLADLSTVPTPNQSSLGNYGIIPVSKYTGNADVTIPLFNTSQRNVCLDVHLSYNTSGLLINQLPDWTGHNWTLFAGGAITRKINGRPDEMDLKGTNTGRDFFILANTLRPKIMSNGVFDDFFIPSLATMDEANTYNQLYAQTLANERQGVKEAEDFTNYFTYADKLNANTTFSDIPSIDKYDTSADIFYFNFMGITGSFFYGNDGNWKVASDHNIDVEFDVKDDTNYIGSLEEYYPCGGPTNAKGQPQQAEYIIKQPKTIKGFTLIDENGNRYIFGGDKNSIEYSMPLVYGAYAYNTTQPWNAISWMLKEVQDRFGNTLYSFRYSRGNYISQIQNAYNIVTLNGKHSSPTSCTGSLTAPVYLDSIHIADGTILQFEHSSIFVDNQFSSLYPNLNTTAMLEAAFPRLTYGQKLDFLGKKYDPINTEYNIFIRSYTDISKKIQESNIEQLDVINITHEKETGNNDTKKLYFLYSSDKRQHLNAVMWDFNNRYLFEYESFDKLPTDYLTKQIDNWGYYNGINYDTPKSQQASTENAQTIKEYINSIKSGTKEPRIPDFNYGGMGMLKKIYYPTGGYSLLEYEQNTCSKYMNDNKQSVIALTEDMPVGGLRIKSIANYYGEKPVGKKTFEYKESNGLSSGILYTLPNAKFRWNQNTTNGNNSYEAETMCSTVPLSNSFASTLGYSTVTETAADGTCITSKYSTTATEKDEMYLYSYYGQDTFTPYDEFCSRNYMRGKLVSEITKDQKGNSVQQSFYTYDSDQTFNKNNYVVTTSFSRPTALPGLVGSVYKLYYFNSGLKSAIKQTKYGYRWVTDTINIFNIHKTLTVNPLNKKAHKVNVSLKTNEILRRAGIMQRTAYTYPYLQSAFYTKFFLPVTCTKQYTNGILSNGSKTEYTVKNGYLVPQVVYNFCDNENAAYPVRQYKSYTANYLVDSYIDECGIIHKLQWDKYNQLVASVANSTEEIKPNESIDKFIDLNKNSVFTSKPIMASLYSYDERGRLATSVDQNKRKSEFCYDSSDRLTTFSVNDEKKAEYSYNYSSNSNDTLATSYGIFSKSVLTVAESAIRGEVQVDYQLKYDIKDAEIRLVHIIYGGIEDCVKISNNSKKGRVCLKGKYFDGQTSVIMLYAGGEYVCQAAQRVNFWK